MKVFISHSFKDAQLAKQFKNLIKKSDKSIGVFCSADEDIPIGEDFNQKIASEIKEANVFIPLISEHYISSKYCMIEFGMAASFVLEETKEMLPVSVFPVKPGDAVAETPLAYLECYDIANKDAVHKILNKIDPDSTITENQIRSFAYKAKKEAVLKTGIVKIAKNIITCAYGQNTEVKDWGDFVRVDQDKEKNEFAVSYSLNPYRLDNPGKLDFISLVLMYYGSLDLLSFANYSKNAKISFEFKRFTSDISKLNVEIKTPNGEIIKKPVEFDVSNGDTICEIPLKDFKVDLLEKTDQICFVVRPDDINDDEGTFIIKGITISV